MEVFSWDRYLEEFFFSMAMFDSRRVCLFFLFLRAFSRLGHWLARPQLRLSCRKAAARQDMGTSQPQVGIPRANWWIWLWVTAPGLRTKVWQSYWDQRIRHPKILDFQISKVLMRMPGAFNRRRPRGNGQQHLSHVHWAQALENHTWTTRWIIENHSHCMSLSDHTCLLHADGLQGNFSGFMMPSSWFLFEVRVFPVHGQW